VLSDYYNVKSSDKTTHDLFQAMEGVPHSSPQQISAVIVPLLSEKNIPVADYFKTYEGNKYNIEWKDYTDFTIFRISKSVSPPKGKRNVSGYFATYTVEGTNFLYASYIDVIESLDFSDFISHNIKQWLDCSYPFVSVMSFSGKHIIEFINHLNAPPRAINILNRRLSFPERSQKTRGKETFEKALERISLEKWATLDRITYEKLDHIQSGPQYSVTLLREGMIYFHNGNISTLRADITKLIHESRKTKTEYSNIIGKRCANEKIYPVLKLCYEGIDFLSDLERSQSLVEALESDKVNMVTLLHGNPYLHIIVTDILDGSTFSVSSSEPNELIISPGSSTTEASLNRLLNTIDVGFGEPTERFEFSLST